MCACVCVFVCLRVSEFESVYVCELLSVCVLSVRVFVLRAKLNSPCFRYENRTRCVFQAREDPSSTYDISGCELTDVPQGVYSLVKVMNKEVGEFDFTPTIHRRKFVVSNPPYTNSSRNGCFTATRPFSTCGLPSFFVLLIHVQPFSNLDSLPRYQSV